MSEREEGPDAGDRGREAGTDDSAVGTVRRYYAALRSGAPLHPFFADSGPVVKVGVGERLIGAESVAEGLREQSRTTAGWEVESRDLHVGSGGPVDEGAELPPHAWFGDDVFLAWTDVERNVRFEFDTRWTGSMQRYDGELRFVVMHVSTAGET